VAQESQHPGSTFEASVPNPPEPPCVVRRNWEDSSRVDTWAPRDGRCCWAARRPLALRYATRPIRESSPTKHDLRLCGACAVPAASATL
jgi:hypothetical protein